MITNNHKKTCPKRYTICYKPKKPQGKEKKESGDLLLLRNHTSRKERLHLIRLLEFNQQRHILVWPNDNQTSLLRVDAVVLVCLSMALMVRHVVNIQAPVIMFRSECGGEIMELRLDAGSRVHGEDME